MEYTMKKILPVLCVLACMSACSGKPGAPQASVDLPKLDTFLLTRSAIPDEIKFDGVIEAINQATVSAQTSGRVLELPVDVGDFVKKGALIARFTDVEQKARAASANAKLAEAKAQYTRMQDMFAKKLIAKADFDKAESTFKSAEANVKEADEGVAHTAIYAPYAGIVVSRMIKVGETVVPGTPLLTGLSLEQLRAQVDIPQQHIGPVRKFKKARILLADGKVLETGDLRIPPSADSQTHSFKVLVNLPSGDHSLFPGTLVKIAFVRGESESLLIPASALAQRGEVNGVYVLSENSIDLRLVRLGSITTDNRYPILAGLNAGDTIALDPIAAANAYKQAHSNAFAKE
jgi:RND family efflux transporter MFP subunit